MKPFELCVVTDRRLSPRPLPEIAAEVARAGGPRVAIQLREKDLAPRELLHLANALLTPIHQYGAQLFVNDRVDVALACGADGVQLSRRSLPARQVRELAGMDIGIGVSTHSVKEILEQDNQAADFIVLGPIFDTPSKRQYGPPLGPRVLEEAREISSKRIIAIGGIKQRHAARILHAGAQGIAVISAILTAPDPAKATEEFLKAMDDSARP